MYNDNIKKIDLHMHSVVSDGTDTPVQIISRVKEAGIDMFSLTDHDAIAGCISIRKRLGKGDPLFVNGVEFSCRDDKGKYHILGYGYDEKGVSIQKAVSRAHDLRMEKVRARLAFLEEQFGFFFSQEDLEELLGRPNPGKPHIGNLMVRYGYAPTRDEAIREYINKKKVPNAYLKPEEAVGAILKSGGIPVLAHPSFGSGGERIEGEELEKRLCRLMDMGLAGVEAFYSGFSKKLILENLSLAKKYRIYVTAGSDYHGTNKLVQPGDTNYAQMVDARRADAPEGLVRFLEIIKEH